MYGIRKPILDVAEQKKHPNWDSLAEPAALMELN